MIDYKPANVLGLPYLNQSSTTAVKVLHVSGG